MANSQTEGALLVGTTGTGKTITAGASDPIPSAKLVWITLSVRRIHTFCRPP